VLLLAVGCGGVPEAEVAAPSEPYAGCEEGLRDGTRTTLV